MGVALGRAGLCRRTALANATLVIGANLPDVDGFIYLFGSPTDALAFRRGWTHGIVAMAVWPLMLAAAMLAWDRIARRPGASPAVPRTLLIVAAAAVWSHPLLDWLNTYGVRLLMPFSPRWFHGDALFIIDPWVWLILGVGVALSRGGRTRPARAALTVASGYAILMAVSSRAGRAEVERQAAAPPASRVLVAPVFGDPFRREVLRDLRGSYEEGALNFGPGARYTPLGRRPDGLGLPGVAEASATRPGSRFRGWARFPLAQVEREGDSLRVELSDLRYGTGRSGSWAVVEITVPAARR